MEDFETASDHNANYLDAFLASSVEAKIAGRPIAVTANGELVYLSRDDAKRLIQWLTQAVAATDKPILADALRTVGDKPFLFSFSKTTTGKPRVGFMGGGKVVHLDTGFAFDIDCNYRLVRVLDWVEAGDILNTEKEGK
jgi:hypothetical protein